MGNHILHCLVFISISRLLKLLAHTWQVWIFNQNCSHTGKIKRKIDLPPLYGILVFERHRDILGIDVSAHFHLVLISNFLEFFQGLSHFFISLWIRVPLIISSICLLQLRTWLGPKPIPSLCCGGLSLVMR